jgi:hypothetical protein
MPARRPDYDNPKLFRRLRTRAYYYDQNHGRSAHKTILPSVGRRTSPRRCRRRGVSGREPPREAQYSVTKVGELAKSDSKTQLFSISANSTHETRYSRCAALQRCDATALSSHFSCPSANKSGIGAGRIRDG